MNKIVETGLEKAYPVSVEIETWEDEIMATTTQDKTHNHGLSDDAIDGIAAIILIAVAVTGVVFWLSSMPY